MGKSKARGPDVARSAFAHAWSNLTAASNQQKANKKIYIYDLNIFKYKLIKYNIEIN